MTGYATLKSFVRGREKRSATKLVQTLEQVAEALTGSGEEGVVQLRIVGEQGPQRYSLKVTPSRCTFQLEGDEKPSLELVAREETAWSILDGSLSPLEAFFQGKMRIRGDAALGQRLLRRIASSSDARFEICEIGV